jgi:hypothetical protein
MSQNQVPMQPQFVIQAQQPGQSGWDKAMGYSASCGKFVGLSGGVVCAIIIIILCGVGIFLYRKQTTAIYNTVSATITEATCSQVVNDNGKTKSISYNCVLKVKYNITGEEYINTVESNDTIHNVGETRTIYYNTANPNDIKYSYISNKNLGEIFIGIGSSFILLLIVHIILTMKSEWYNRLQCLSAVSNTIAAPFN